MLVLDMVSRHMLWLFSWLKICKRVARALSNAAYVVDRDWTWLSDVHSTSHVVELGLSLPLGMSAMHWQPGSAVSLPRHVGAILPLA